VRWSETKAPSIRDFEEIAAAAYKVLPEQFLALAGNVVIGVDDFADDETLDSLGIESEFDLLGVYQGVPLDQQSMMDLPRPPEMVMLYRRPILDYWSEHDETLGAVIVHVLVHEIGHHFGLSDADMAAIEASVA
jgi:predicted Zn-dependent protease with MMP-like domain